MNNTLKKILYLITLLLCIFPASCFSQKNIEPCLDYPFMVEVSNGPAFDFENQDTSINYRFVKLSYDAREKVRFEKIVSINGGYTKIVVKHFDLITRNLEFQREEFLEIKLVRWITSSDVLIEINGTQFKITMMEDQLTVSLYNE